MSQNEPFFGCFGCCVLPKRERGHEEHISETLPSVVMPEVAAGYGSIEESLMRQCLDGQTRCVRTATLLICLCVAAGPEKVCRGYLHKKPNHFTEIPVF